MNKQNQQNYHVDPQDFYKDVREENIQGDNLNKDNIKQGAQQERRKSYEDIIRESSERLEHGDNK
jgi:hypothetical protein